MARTTADLFHGRNAVSLLSNPGKRSVRQAIGVSMHSMARSASTVRPSPTAWPNTQTLMRVPSGSRERTCRKASIASRYLDFSGRFSELPMLPEASSTTAMAPAGLLFELASALRSPQSHSRRMGDG